MAENQNYYSIVSDIENNKIRNLYLFHGSETLLMNDVLSRITKRVLAQSFISLNFIKIDGSDVTYDALINACETLPFMDEKKIVSINDCIFFKGKKSKKDDAGEDRQFDSLCDYISRIPDTTILIFLVYGELDKRKKLFNQVKKYGDIVEFGPLKGEELIKWIIKEFGKLDKTIAKKEAVYFADRVIGSLNDTLNEINKLCSYIGKRNTIQKSDIDAVVPKTLEMNIFQLVDAVSANNPDQALLILNELLLDSEPVPLILSMIIRQFRLLLSIKLLNQKGYSNTEAAEKLGLKPFVFSNLQKVSSSFTEAKLQERLMRCLETDGAIKKGKMEQRIAIESLMVEFAK